MAKLVHRLALLALLPLAACNQNPTNPFAATVPTPSPGVVAATAQDSNFMMQAAMSDMLEIQAAQIALQKSRRPAVRRYAQQMIDDHQASTARLTTIAQAMGATLPTALDPVQDQMLARLRSASVRGFDGSYRTAMASSHRDAVQVFRTETTAGTDPNLKQFAQMQLPTIEGHLSMAEGLPR